ncbi:MAG: hypothetical protein HY561_02260 [Gemmatimonadetes bacterium]|nr:hypothetical protein [Gemmatimonadota bacterium]
MVATGLGPKREEPEPIEYAETLEPLHRERGVWDRFGLWTALAIVLVLLAYAVPLLGLLRLERFGSPGFQPF